MDQIIRPLVTITLIEMMVAIGQSNFVTEIRPRVVAGMFGLLVASMAIGWLLGGPTSDTRKVMALTTPLRNVGVGLVIAASAFASTPAITAVVAFGLVSLIGTLAVATMARAVGSDPKNRMEGAAATASRHRGRMQRAFFRQKN